VNPLILLESCFSNLPPSPTNLNMRDAQSRAMATATKDTSELGGIGKHCTFCRRLDFLPFTCGQCNEVFCLDHRALFAHSCKETSSAPGPDKPPAKAPRDTKIYQTCHRDDCDQKISSAGELGTKPRVTCPKCHRAFCLSHRLDHICTPPLLDGSHKKDASSTSSASNALAKLKSWAKKKSESRTPSTSKYVEIANLKKTCKGDSVIPLANRVYLHIEDAEGGGKGAFFYSCEWSVGKILDRICRDLSLRNMNNISDSDEKKLRVFHVDAGRVLSFTDSLKQCGVKNGDTLAVVRGLHM